MIRVNPCKSVAAFVLLIISLPGNVAAQTPDTFRGAEVTDQNSIGDLKWFEVFKDQSDAQLRDFQKTAEKWFDVFAKA